MTTVPLHPAIVHVPLGLAFVLPIVAAGIAIAMCRGVVPRRTWVIAVALQATLVVGGGVALRTGEQDERRVERITGEAAIDAHEHAAEAFLWGAGVVLAIAAAAAIVPVRMAATVAALAAVGTLAVAGLAYRTGKAGGELVYARGGATAYGASGAPPSALAASPADRADHALGAPKRRHHRE